MKFVDVDKIIWRQSPFLTVSGLSDPQGELKFDLFVTSADLDEMPPADVVERKKGKWIHIGGDEWVCDKCGFALTTEGSWEHPLDAGNYYCKHCGADMREGENE